MPRRQLVATHSYRDLLIFERKARVDIAEAEKQARKKR